MTHNTSLSAEARSVSPTALLPLSFFGLDENYLSAIRTAFDKMCFRDVTLGLTTPRRPRKLPVVLSECEVRRLLDAAPTQRDQLLFGLMYATGLRVSEVARLRYRDLDFDRELINVWLGKGGADRQVTTTNYVKVARPGEDLAHPSPLDVMAGKRSDATIHDRRATLDHLSAGYVSTSRPRPPTHHSVPAQ